MAKVTQELEEEGVASFSESITAVLKTIDDRRKNDVASLGPLADAVSKRMARLEAESIPARLWTHDPTLWTNIPAEQAEVKNRMGWLDSPEKARGLLPLYQSFADEIRSAHLSRALVLGRGGSSLTAEAFSLLLAAANISGPVRLAILDSTDPGQVTKAAADYPAENSLYIVASKSGGTAEVSANYDLFWSLTHSERSRFVATTDPGTSLELLARERAFRKIFSADESVGGRYSALTDFGMVPAALLGFDLPRLLDRADWMKRQCLRDVPAARNPGLALGAVLGEAALAGMDKLTILADAPLAAPAAWIEQLVAETRGEEGKGILPVPLEPVDAPEVYGKDRMFVYLKQGGELENAISALRTAGFPVLEFAVADPYEAPGEFFRWAFATAVACHILGVNAFNQPDVQEAKDRTKAKIAEYHASGKLAEGKSIELGGAKDALAEFLSQAGSGTYVPINPYVARNESAVQALQRIRVAIREKT